MLSSGMGDARLVGLRSGMREVTEYMRYLTRQCRPVRRIGREEDARTEIRNYQTDPLSAY